MNPLRNLGQLEVTFLSSALPTGGGASVPPSYPSTHRTRKIAKQFAEESWLSTTGGVCWYCGRERHLALMVEIGENYWHLGCVEREIDRREWVL